jgi:S1-C subfamily serine protease
LIDMSRGRAPAIAIGAAIVALAISAVAIVVVATRTIPETPAAAATATRVAAAELARLRQDTVRVERPTGISVTDDALRRSLGLDAGDVITHVAGRPIRRTSDLATAMLAASSLDAAFVYAEVLRDGRAITIRWDVDGDLRAARLGVARDQAVDPFVASVEKLDRHRYAVPRSTVDRVLANPADFVRAVRVLPAVDGVRLDSIRRDTLVAALGFEDGDLVRAVNGISIAGLANVVDVLAKLRDAKEIAIDITRRGKYELISVSI